MPRNRNTKRSRRSQAEDFYDTEDPRPARILYPQPKVYTISHQYKNQVQGNEGYRPYRQMSRSPFRQATKNIFRPISPQTSEGERSEPDSDASVETVVEANHRSSRNYRGQNRYRYKFYPPPMRRFPSRPTVSPLRKLENSNLRATYTLTLRADEPTKLTGESTGKLYAKIPEGTLIQADSQIQGQSGRTYQVARSSQTAKPVLATFQADFATLKL
jgi:hypothetical protein